MNCGTSRVRTLLPVSSLHAPGEYVLQIVATDEAAGGRPQASQWIDFEVVR